MSTPGCRALARLSTPGSAIGGQKLDATHQRGDDDGGLAWRLCLGRRGCNRRQSHSLFADLIGRENRGTAPAGECIFSVHVAINALQAISQQAHVGRLLLEFGDLAIADFLNLG